MRFQAVYVALALPLLAFGYVSGPDAAVSGVPGELGTCAACHSGSSGSGSVSLKFPGDLTYTPGVKQHVIVTVADSAQKRWGFQTTARQVSNTKSMAGSFAPTDSYTQTVCTQSALQTEKFSNSCLSTATPLQYIEHTSAGTRLNTKNSVTFEFDWTPPTSDIGPVEFFVVGNAANGDNSERGDHIYTAKYTLTMVPPAPPKPVITQNGITNFAGGGTDFAAGAWMTIQGTNLASSTRTYTANDVQAGALPTMLDNVSVTVDGKPAAIVSISPAQLVVIAPADDNVGPVPVVVSNSNVASDAVNIQLLPAAPEPFLWKTKYAVLTTPDATALRDVLNAPDTISTAQPGSNIVLWADGLGATTPASDPTMLVPPDTPYAPAALPVVTIGGVPATVVSAALAPGSAHLYAITVTVPDVPDGEQPVTLQVGGVSSTATAVVTVQH